MTPRRSLWRCADFVRNWGSTDVAQLVAIVNDQKEARIPSLARNCLIALGLQLDVLRQQIRVLDRRLR